MPKFISEININDQFTLPIISGSDGQVLQATNTMLTEWKDLPTIPSGNQIIDWTVSQGGGSVIHADNYTSGATLSEADITAMGFIQTQAEIEALGFSTTDNDTQDLSISGRTVSLTNGGSVDIPYTNWNDIDGSQDEIGLSGFDNDLNFGEGTVSGTGTDNRIAMFDGTANIQNSNIYYAANNYIGINTTPTSPLHVYNNEDGKSTDLLLENGDVTMAAGQFVGSVRFMSSDASTSASGNAGRIISMAENTTGGYGMSFRVKDGSTENTPLYIKRDGNVGIGTDEPDSELHVYANNADAPTVLTIENGDAGVVAGQDLSKIEFLTSDVSAPGAGVAASIRTVCQNAGNIFDLAFNVQNGATRTERMRLDGAGKLGIGTTDPQGMVDIEGMNATVPAIKVNSGTGKNRVMDIYNSANTKRMGVEYDNSNINLNVTNRSGASKVTIRETGNVGIGTETPRSKLSVVGLASFLSNSAALSGGLIVGDFYHTAGTLKVVI